jgi:hypothetical protein
MNDEEGHLRLRFHMKIGVMQTVFARRDEIRRTITRLGLDLRNEKTENYYIIISPYNRKSLKYYFVSFSKGLQISLFFWRDIKSDLLLGLRI